MTEEKKSGGPVQTGAPEITPELLERAKNRDRDALAELYEATNLEVYRTVRALIRDEDLALDVQQDAYLRAFSSLDQLREPAAFLPWLKRIAVNEAKALLRRKKPILFSELADGDAEEPELPDEREESSPALQLDRRETARLVREILDGLPDGQRMLMGMYYYEQIPIRKIADDLSLSPGTVKAQLFRGRKRIEAEVRRLEAQGVKLWGLSPIPFLLALLKRQEPAAGAAERVLTGSLAKAGIVSETAMVHVGRRFFETVAGRVLLGLLTAAAIGGGIAGWRWVRENYNTGDVQPTETMDVLLMDSDENLPTGPSEDPTVPITLPDSGEDLTEPVETAEPTDPEPTDPEPTDPEPTDPPPAVPADPGGHDPADPGGYEDDPNHSDPAESARPVSPTPSDTEETIPAVQDDTTTETKPVTDKPGLEPKFLRWYWLDQRYAASPEDVTSMDLTDQLFPDHGAILRVEVQGALAPSVTADTPGVITLEDGWKEELHDGIERYNWCVRYAGCGSTRLSCSFNGTVVGTLTITNPDCSAKYLYSYWTLWASVQGEGTDERTGEKLIGNSDCLWVYEEHNVNETPSVRVYTDSPNVLSVEYLNSGPGNRWCQQYTRWSIKAIGCGTAKLYVEYNGRIAKSYTIPVPDGPDSILRFQWMIQNDTNTYGVGGLNIIDMLIEGNEIPRVFSDNPEIVRVTMTGYSGGETVDRIRGYSIKLNMKSPGTANLIVEYQGAIKYLFPITVLADP